MPFAPIDEILQDLRDGKMIVLVDDEDRENEGDLTMAAEKVTPEAINFMAKYGRGLICLTLTDELADRLNLPLMAEMNTSNFGTAFTVSIDAAKGTTTGISAKDRAVTILASIDDNAKPEDLSRPGHIFPLRAKEGGVLVRTGQTEGSVDLAKLAGLKPAGVICEIMNDDGTMARVPQLMEFCKEHNIKMASIADIIKYRRKHERLIERKVSTTLPTRYGEFNVHLYSSKVDEYLHIAITKGDDLIPYDLPGHKSINEPVLVRVHSECLTGDIFHSLRCDCGDQLELALQKITEAGRGVLLYMRQEGRGIGLENKLRAYALQDEGMDTVDANIKLGFAPDLRDYGIGAQILVDLGIKELSIMTNNPKKLIALDGYGLSVKERVPLEIKPCAKNKKYLKTKQKRMGHILEIDD